jgi:hypothetical protein
MKKKILQQIRLALALGVAVIVPQPSNAGGNMGQRIATFEPMKADADAGKLKEGDTVVKVCRACGAVTLVRVEKGSKGLYDFTAKKCDACGSENTYMAVSKQFIPFKEQDKR